ncbi:hypothetical protein AAY473_031875 [Plecturocebus cupreus]
MEFHCVGQDGLDRLTSEEWSSRDGDRRDQTMSCIHCGLGQSQAGASRPRAAPPATAPAGGKPGSRRPSAAIPVGTRGASTAPCPGRGGLGDGRRGSHGDKVVHRGQNAPPSPLECGVVPLRRSSSRGRAALRRPRRRGQRHPGYRAGSGCGPAGSFPIPAGRPACCRWARRNLRTKRLPQAQGRAAAAAAHPPPSRELQGRDTGASTRVTNAQPPGPRGARPPQAQARPTSCACPGGGAHLISQ